MLLHGRAVSTPAAPLHRQVWRTRTRCLQGLCTLRWASWCSPCAGRGVRRRRRLPSSMWKSRHLVAPHGGLGGAPGYVAGQRPAFALVSSRGFLYTHHPGRAQGEAAAGVPARALLRLGGCGGAAQPHGVKPRRGARERVCVLCTFRCAPFIMSSLCFITRSMPVAKMSESLYTLVILSPWSVPWCWRVCGEFRLHVRAWVCQEALNRCGAALCMNS